MKIELENDNKIVISLSNEDMITLDITFEDLDYQNIETRRVIWTLLDEARQTLNKDINLCEKMLIEVSKNIEGGCTIYFTMLPESSHTGTNRLIMKKEPPEIVATFKNFSSIEDFFERYKILGDSICESELYIYESGYALILEPKLSKRQSIELCISEFGSLCPSNAITLSHIREYGNKISYWGTLS